jgi:hypothetical protein
MRVAVTGGLETPVLRGRLQRPDRDGLSAPAVSSSRLPPLAQGERRPMSRSDASVLGAEETPLLAPLPSLAGKSRTRAEAPPGPSH